MTAPDGKLLVDADSLSSTAQQVDQVVAELTDWWERLSNEASGHEATLRQCTTQVASGFFDGADGKPGYTVNTSCVGDFIATVQQVLGGQFAPALREGAANLNETEAANVDAFNSVDRTTIV